MYIVPILLFDSEGEGTLLTKNWDNLDIVTYSISKVITWK